MKALAPFNGLPITSTMMEGYANAVLDNGFYNNQYTPMMEVLTTSKDMAGNTVKWVDGGSERINES